ncbi:MAG TPA: tetratricopeptide repeat protein [Pyrinomonadaceae bacterium]|nr:tetratricopeptide repeat protein [Pyrinomonadaceae bacterium]
MFTGKLANRDATVGAALRGRPSCAIQISGNTGGHGVPPLQLLLLILVLCASSTSISAQSTRKSRPKAPAQQAGVTDADFDRLVKLADEARLAERFEEAVSLYGKALNIRPKWPEGWWYVGAIFYQKDLYPQGRDAFQNLVALKPDQGQAWAMLGLCLFQTGEYERAATSLQRSRSLGVNDNSELAGVVRYHTALVYIHFEYFEIAFDILTEFVKAGNQSQKVIEAFGLTMLRMPFLPEKIPADQREKVLIAGQAGYNMAARRLEQARAAFDMLLARYPNDPNVHYGFGIFMLSQDADLALKEFQRELEISPNHFPAMVQMAFEYLKRAQYNDALPLAEKAVQLAPKLYAARNVLGRVLLELGQVDRSIQELEEGVKLAPSSPEMHFALARAYTRAGRKQDADRERETFKKLQDEYNQKRQLDRSGATPDQNPDKPNPQ